MMDPDANLAQIRELRKFFMEPPDEMTPGLTNAFIDKAVELAALIEAQDEWMSKGGFLPADWAKGRPSPG